MSPQIIGLLAGVVAGLIGFFAMSSAAKQIEGNLRDPAKVRTANLLRTIGKIEVFLFAAVGYFAGPMVLQ